MVLIEGIGDELTILISAILGVGIIWILWQSTRVRDNSALLHVQLGNSNAFNEVWRRVQELSAHGTQARINRDRLHQQLEQYRFDQLDADVVAPEAPGDIAPPTADNTDVPVDPSSFSGMVLQYIPSVTDIWSLFGVPESNAPVPEPATPETATITTSEEQAPGVISEADEPGVPSTSTQCDDSEQIEVTIKFLSDLRKKITIRKNDTVATIRSTHFNDEIIAGKTVRFVFAGRVIQRDEEKFADFGIGDGSVVHCQVVQNSGRQPPSNEAPEAPTAHAYDEGGDNLDVSNLLFVLFGAFLVVFWYLRFAYRNLFTVPTTFTLIAISVLFLIAVYANFSIL